jgi:hypothetical protein
VPAAVATSVKHAFAAPRCWREVPLVLSRDGALADPFAGPLVTGRVDLVCQDGGELVVVGYEAASDVTVENAEKHACEHDSRQSEVYAQALSAATGFSCPQSRLRVLQGGSRGGVPRRSDRVRLANRRDHDHGK